MATKPTPAPAEDPTEQVEPFPEPEAAPTPPQTPSEFDQKAQWDPTFRSMLDCPGHPLAHLKGV